MLNSRHSDIRASSDFLSCVHKTFVRSPDFRVLILSILSMINLAIRLSCVHENIVLLTDFCMFMSTTNFCALMYRLLCDHLETCARSSSNFRALIQSYPELEKNLRFCCVFVRSCLDFCAFITIESTEIVDQNWSRVIPALGALSELKQSSPRVRDLSTLCLVLTV